MQLIRADGTHDVGGVRLRLAPGVGGGSLLDEMARGVVTPLASEAVRAELLRTLRGEAAELVARLPAARPRRPDDGPAPRTGARTIGPCATE